MSTKPSKTKILMVCLGNICRSPLAQGILESKLPKESYFIDSAGTAAYHIGNKPDRRSIQVAKTNGIDINSQRARQFSTSDFENFDIIYVMDQSNLENILRLAESKKDRNKVALILNENPSVTDKNVPDPYYSGESGFKYVFDILNETCEIIADKIKL